SPAPLAGGSLERAGHGARHAEEEEVKNAALVLAGVWLGALVASWVAATVNFRTVDRVLGADQRPELARTLDPVSREDRRQALRHLASEINRWSFRWWSAAQLALAGVLLLLAWRMPGPRAALLAAALIVAGQLLLVRPIVDLGRAIDFVPRPLPPEIARRFGLMHAAFVIGDLAKAALLVLAAWLLGRR
ncbi:MAG TPA: hypothetical protein VFO85_19410, partial [Vicinamibacteria bacterium]|nr:hypothetical protein [Vicinamibacteria bacterium]